MYTEAQAKSVAKGVGGMKQVKVPAKLEEMQLWFGAVVARPPEGQNHCLSGSEVEEEARRWIAPGGALQAHERMQIYSQQYWWRLLKVLHETFPLTTRLFGRRDFDEMIAIPYLKQCPPNHYVLDQIGNRLSGWVEEAYADADKSLVRDAVAIDWAFMECFSAAHHKAYQGGGSEEIWNTVFFLQPHVRLFALPYDLFAFREEFLKEGPDFWLYHDFPRLEKGRRFFFLMYRSTLNAIEIVEVPEASFLFLAKFRSGCSFKHAWSEAGSEAKENLQLWLQTWIIDELLTTESGKNHG